MIVIDSNDFVRFVFNQERSAQRSVRGSWISSGGTVMTPCELELMIRYVLPRRSESHWVLWKHLIHFWPLKALDQPRICILSKLSDHYKSLQDKKLSWPFSSWDLSVFIYLFFCMHACSEFGIKKNLSGQRHNRSWMKLNIQICWRHWESYFLCYTAEKAFIDQVFWS